MNRFMPTLLHQAQEIADLLEAAIEEQKRDYAPGEEISFINGEGVRSIKVSGSTVEERIACVMRAYSSEIVELIVIVQDGSDYFGDIDRSELFRLLEGSFSPDTKGARRYLLAGSSILFLIGATRETPAKVPGFDFDLKNHPWIVTAMVLGVLAYQGVAFVLHARADLARRSIAEGGIREQLGGLKRCLSRISAALSVLARSPWPDDFSRYTESWRAYASREVGRLDREWSALLHRKGWELWLPVPIVLISVTTFVLRSLW
jgi:hypothetical protein